MVEEVSSRFRKARATRVSLSPADVADLQPADRLHHRGRSPFTSVKADGVQPISYANHWWLVVWCKARGLIRVLHSLAHCETVHTRAAVRGFVRELLGEYMAVQVATLDTAVDLFDVPQEQTGSDDCGAFVLWMLQAYELDGVDLLQKPLVLLVDQGTLRAKLAASVTALAQGRSSMRRARACCACAHGHVSSLVARVPSLTLSLSLFGFGSRRRARRRSGRPVHRRSGRSSGASAGAEASLRRGRNPTVRASRGCARRGPEHRVRQGGRFLGAG